MFIKISEYSKKYGVNRNSVIKAIAAKKLKVDETKKVKMVEDVDYRTKNLSASETLAEARKKKLIVDIELQKQKLGIEKKKIQSELLDDIVFAYSQSFLKLKNEFIKLRLGKDETKKIQELFSQSSENFIKKIKEIQREREKND